MRKFIGVCHIRSTDRLHLIKAGRLARSGADETIAQQTHGALTDGEQQLLFVAEIHVHQRPRQARAARHLIDSDRIPARLGIQHLSRIKDLGAPPLLFFAPTFSNIGHELNDR